MEALNDPDVTMKVVENEMLHHAPYFLLEHITFLIGFGYQDQALADAYRTLYDEAVAKFDHKVPESPVSSSFNYTISFIILFSTFIL